MDLFTAMELSGSALTAQKIRLNVIASNMANIHTTKTPEGGPYQKREVVFEAVPKRNAFERELDAVAARNISECKVSQIARSQAPFRKVFNPHHPHADAEGYVTMPNVDVVYEMVDLMDASRGYEANLAVAGTSRSMAQRALELGR
jgi:flagellar basal-body rod protein FlgC